MSNRKLLVILLPIFAVVLGLACSLVYVLSIGNEVICPDSSDGITGETSMDITEDQTSGEPPEEPSEILPQSDSLCKAMKQKPTPKQASCSSKVPLL